MKEHAIPNAQFITQKAFNQNRQKIILTRIRKQDYPFLIRYLLLARKFAIATF